MCQKEENNPLAHAKAARSFKVGASTATGINRIVENMRELFFKEAVRSGIKPTSRGKGRNVPAFMDAVEFLYRHSAYTPEDLQEFVTKAIANEKRA